MRQTVGKVLAETTSCVNIEHPWSGIITKFIRMRIKIQILKGEVGPILYWLLLAGSTHQIIKFIISPLHIFSKLQFVLFIIIINTMNFAIISTIITNSITKVEFDFLQCNTKQ